MTKEALQVTLRNAAPDRIGRERVLLPFVERGWGQLGVTHSITPDALQALSAQVPSVRV
jgi:hypothetical protein